MSGLQVFRFDPPLPPLKRGEFWFEPLHFFLYSIPPNPLKKGGVLVLNPQPS